MIVQSLPYLLVLLHLALPAGGQGTAPVFVDDIIVTGNRSTEARVILRELEHQVGGEFNPDILEYEKRRVYSLGLFNRVEITPYINGERATIHIDVHERWHIIPVPVLGIKDRDWKKVYYGFGIIHNNFRGRNEKLWAGAAFGYDPWVSLMYANPAIFGRDNLFFETQLIYTKTESRNILYAEDQRGFGERRYIAEITGGRRFSLYTTVSVMLGFNSISIDPYVDGHTRSPEGRDRYMLGSVTYAYDTRDIAEYPMMGTFVRTSVSKAGFGESRVDHFRTSLDARRYVPVSDRFTIAGRAFTSVAGGTRLPYHSHRYIGYEEKIRGYFSEVFEGENLFISSLEARFALVGPNYLEWQSALAPEFSVLRYGVNLALFGDLGTTWFRHDALRELRPVKGFGAGVHLLLPYSTVLRFEYAFNESMDGEFIFDLFVMF
jgi:outer membrane protein assembly factor BamA